MSLALGVIDRHGWKSTGTRSSSHEEHHGDSRDSRSFAKTGNSPDAEIEERAADEIQEGEDLVA